jgi:hypothetical protein
MERDLRAKLLQADTELVQAILKKMTAIVEYVERDGSEALIKVDPFMGGILECTLHELIHATYRPQLSQWGRMEETLVLALEKSMAFYIKRKLPLQRDWRRMIAKKLAEAEA